MRGSRTAGKSPESNKMWKKKQIWNAYYLQKILKDISFTQQICIHAHDVTLTARKIAGNKTNKQKSPTLTEFAFPSKKRDNKQV